MLSGGASSVPVRTVVAEPRSSEARGVPDFKWMHEEWQNKVQRSKDQARKAVTVTQEFSFASRRPKESTSIQKTIAGLALIPFLEIFVC